MSGSSVPDRLTGVERAIALRRVEAFQAVPLEQLAHLGSLAREDWFAAGSALFREGDPPGGLSVILAGRIRLERGGAAFAEAGPGEALGTWALFDEAPRRATAVVGEDARVLTLDREEFYQALSDHVEITRSLVQDLVRRLHALVGLAGESGEGA